MNVMKLIKAFTVASRGRNPDNPSDRTKGIYLEQRFEINWGGVLQHYNKCTERQLCIGSLWKR